MSEPDFSFDPSTWLKGEKDANPASQEPAPSPTDTSKGPPNPSKAGETTAPTSEEAAHSGSFDPATWGSGAKVAGAPTIAEAPPVAAATTKVGPPSRRTLLIGGAALAGVVAVGGGLVLALRRSSATSAAGADPTAQMAATAPTVAASTEHQALTLPDMNSVQAALVSYGLDKDDSAKISAAAVSAMPKSGSSDTLRMALVLNRVGAKPSLISMAVSRPDGSGAKVIVGANGFLGSQLSPNVRQEVKVVRGQVDSESFYSSAVTAGLSDRIIPDFFQAFVYDFDFQREIEAGAAFEAAIAGDVNDQGATIGKSKLLYAGMTTAKKALALYRYDAPGAKPDDPPWYDGSGRSIKRGLMRTPVEGARISSSFGWRVHPILGFQKLHKGTDFAAPVGTPIYASGDGAVEWAAMKGPNGNLTILKHDNGWETYYLHQNAFAPGVAPGARVRQGQNIGWVGTTGRSTGPHLHYELHINGEAVDAMAQPLDAGETLKGDALSGFFKQRDQIDKLRASAL